MSYNSGKNWKKRNSIGLEMSSLNLPKIDLGLHRVNYKRSFQDKMFDLFSDKMEKVVMKNWNNVDVIGFDTDSYFLNIQTEDVYEDMKNIQNELDTSAYDKNHFLSNQTNKKVIGKFKDELNGELMTELVFLKAKCYAYRIKGTDFKKYKGK